MIFPYVRHWVDESSAIPSGEVARPEILVRISGSTGAIEVSGLIDTGADQVFLPSSLAELLGIQLAEDPSEGAESAGGQALKMWPCEVQLEIVGDDQSYCWTVQAGFLDGSSGPAAAYLGHAGFLEYFHATFDGEAKTVELISNNRLPKE